MKLVLTSTVVLGLLLLFVPIEQVSAQSGFVPCDGANCSACDFVSMINVIIKWLFGMIFVLFAVLMTKAGFGLVTSGGNQGALDAAKSHFQNALIGIIIVMAGWLIVDTIMKGTLKGGTGEISGFGPWSSVQCQSQLSPQAFDASEEPQANGTPPDPTVTAACTDDAALKVKYKGSSIGVEAPGLRTMINCYLGDASIAAMTNTGSLYTIDLSHPRCSLTNGNTACGPCSHSTNSKHYGRGSGLGAQAVDFNAKDGSLAGETALFNRIKTMQSACGGSAIFETNPGAIHTHISM